MLSVEDGIISLWIVREDGWVGWKLQEGKEKGLEF